MKKILFLLLVVCGLAACDKGGDDTPKDITITGGSTNQTIYADQTSVNNGEGIKFSTTGAWRTEIEEVTRAVSWIELSQTSGDKAGDYILQITLGQNTTGDDRKATIKIICGDTIITITVEQKGTTEDGNIPEEPDVPEVENKRITKIEKIDNRTEGVRGSQLNEFFYDNLNRVNKIVVTETEIEGVGSAEKTTTWISTNIITYTDNTVSYNWTLTKNGVLLKEETNGEITLDNNNRAISGKGSYIETSDTKETRMTYSLEYNTDGYLTKSESFDSDNQNETKVEKLIWTNGNLTQVWWGENVSHDYYIDKAIYGTVPNKTNLDLNWFYETGLPVTEGFAFACVDSQNIFSLLGYVGKRAKNLVEQLSKGYSGITDFKTKNSYTVDADGYPIMIEQSYKQYFGGENNQSFEWVKGMPYKITYNK